MLLVVFGSSHFTKVIDDGYGLGNAKIENGLAVLAQSIMTPRRPLGNPENTEETAAAYIGRPLLAEEGKAIDNGSVSRYSSRRRELVSNSTFVRQ
jgi:hypothetical protein